MCLPGCPMHSTFPSRQPSRLRPTRRRNSPWPGRQPARNSRPAGHARRRDRGDPGRRPCHPADQPDMPPGFPCQRLVVVEVYTPGGNWSSYPPHKHDMHAAGPTAACCKPTLTRSTTTRSTGRKATRCSGFTRTPESPLHAAGYPIDATVIARNDDVVLIPEGYHPVSSPVGYTTYYLNVLAGSAQSLASKDDPDFAWVKDTYRGRDPRCRLSGPEDRDRTQRTQIGRIGMIPDLEICVASASSASCSCLTFGPVIKEDSSCPNPHRAPHHGARRSSAF